MLPRDHPFLGSLRHVVNQPTPTPLPPAPRLTLRHQRPRDARETREIRGSVESTPSAYSRPASRVPSETFGPPKPEQLDRWDKEVAFNGPGPFGLTSTGEFGDIKTSRMSIVSGPRITRYGDLPWNSSDVTVDRFHGDGERLDTGSEGRAVSTGKTRLLTFSRPGSRDRQISAKIPLGEEKVENKVFSVPGKITFQQRSLSPSTRSTDSPCPLTPEISVEQDPFAAVPLRRTPTPSRRKKSTRRPQARLPVVQVHPESPPEVAPDSNVNVTPRKRPILPLDPAASPPGFIGSTTPPFSLISLEEARERQRERTRRGLPSAFKMSMSPDAVRGAISTPTPPSERAEEEQFEKELPPIPLYEVPRSRPGTATSLSAGVRLQPRKSIIRIFKTDKGKKAQAAGQSTASLITPVSSTLDSPIEHRTPTPFPRQTVPPSPSLSTESHWAGSDEAFWGREPTPPEEPLTPVPALQPLELRSVSIDIRRGLPQSFLVEQPGQITRSSTSASLPLTHRRSRLPPLSISHTKAEQAPRLTTMRGASASSLNVGHGEDSTTPRATEDDRIAKLEAQVRQLLSTLASSPTSSTLANEGGEVCQHCGCACRGAIAIVPSSLGIRDRGKKLGLAASRMFGSTKW